MTIPELKHSVVSLPSFNNNEHTMHIRGGKF